MPITKPKKPTKASKTTTKTTKVGENQVSRKTVGKVEKPKDPSNKSQTMPLRKADKKPQNNSKPDYRKAAVSNSVSKALAKTEADRRKRREVKRVTNILEGTIAALESMNL